MLVNLLCGMAVGFFLSQLLVLVVFVVRDRWFR
jgi:hypothetical protein